MLFLRHKEDPVAFYLGEDKTYTIGRKQSDILIENDNSISRQHAAITVKNGCVTITDLKAKYKTFINLEPLQEQECRTIERSDTIRFGIQKNIYTLEEVKIKTICSGLNNAEKNKLTQYIKFLNGCLYSNWCIECTHLTLQEIVLTVKVLCALIEGQQIVTLKYWEDFITNVKNNLPPPDAENYKPLSAESILNKNITFKYNSLRKTLFSNKIFVFATAKEKNKMEELINLTGGQCITLNEKSLKPADFHSTEPEYIIIQDQTQTKGTDSYNSIISYLSQIDKRLIPQQEIAIAIVTCSCEQNCNPNFNRGKTLIQPKSDLLKTQDVLVQQTPSQSQAFFTEDQKPCTVIPQTAEDDVFAVAEGLVTSTQIQESSSVFKPFSIEVSNIKREGELLENKTFKRLKIDETKRPDVDEKIPFNHQKFAQSKRQDQQKSLDTSNLQNGQTSGNSVTAARTFKIEAAIPSRKRENDNADQIERPLKKLTGTNPFGEPVKRKFVSTPISWNSVQDKLTNTDNVKLNRMENQIVVQEPTSNITVASRQLEHSFPWISKSSTKIKPRLEQQDNNNSSDVTDPVVNYINSLKHCIIIKTLPLIVRTSLQNFGAENTCLGIKNFKKFKKVQPLYPQTTIIPNTAYKIFRCGADY